jgi:small-conductance mechanosensitive channel
MAGLDTLRETFIHALAWVDHTIFVPATLAQAGVVLVLLLLMSSIARSLRGSLATQVARLPQGLLPPVATALLQVVPWIVLILLLWFGQLAFNAEGQRADLLRLIESLALAWVVIRLSSNLVRDPRIAQAISVAAWIFAALNIAGLINPLVGLLDSMALPIGNFHLSLLLVIKGAITLVIAVWLANVLSRLADQRLRRLPGMAPALQVLTAKLTRMILLALAVVLAMGSVGIDLTAFTVFSGAVGVGIGFGLQKVVSNLITGVILLLDRSIKPGDVIEIEGTYGWITNLNARYVALSTRDGKEHLIPNEDLITQRVVNWSFSNNLIRLHVPIGISYQSDPHQAIALSLQAGASVDRVLTEPKPVCIVKQFGDSSIDLELRFWIKDPINGTANVRSEVMLNIWDLFKTHHIDIPKPQRDLTLRNPEALALALSKHSLATTSTT